MPRIVILIFIGGKKKKRVMNRVLFVLIYDKKNTIQDKNITNRLGTAVKLVSVRRKQNDRREPSVQDQCPLTGT